MRLKNDDPKVLARSANRPRATCTLMNSPSFSCDDCRSMTPINIGNVKYFCIAEVQEKRFWKHMKETKRTIQMGWANNYLLEKNREEADNNEGCAKSGNTIQSEAGLVVDQMGVHGETPDASGGEEVRETAEIVGECFV